MEEVVYKQLKITQFIEGRKLVLGWMVTIQEILDLSKFHFSLNIFFCCISIALLVHLDEHA